MEKRKKSINMMMTENQPSSLFKRREIVSISEIFELYLFLDLNQQTVNAITFQSALFLKNIKDIDAQLIENNFSIFFDIKEKGAYISVSGKNLLSSLWIIGVYPENPEELVDKIVYKNGDFTYRFNTKTRNLALTQNRKNERKLTNHPRNLKIP